jgi:hypothetical protein
MQTYFDPNATNAIKLPARYTTTGAVTLSGLGSQATGDWVGSSLTAADRILVKNQADATTNGIYSAAAGAWTRTTDFDNSVEVIAGTIIVIAEGVTLADTVWQLSTNNPITIGVTALTFVKIGQISSITGTLTTDRLPVATGANTIGNSYLLQNAGGVLVDNTKIISSSNGQTVFDPGSGGYISMLQSADGFENSAGVYVHSGATALAGFARGVQSNTTYTELRHATETNIIGPTVSVGIISTTINVGTTVGAKAINIAAAGDTISSNGSWTHNDNFTLGANLISADKVINASADDSATIDSIAGRFRKDTSGSTFTLTNNLITANSIILLSYASSPGITGFTMVGVAGAGSAVITFYTSGAAGAPTADTDVNFLVVN